MFCCCAGEESTRDATFEADVSLSAAAAGETTPVKEPIASSVQRSSPTATAAAAAIVSATEACETYKTTISRPSRDDAWGLTLESTPGTASLVARIGTGALESFNKTAPEGTQVKQYDFIINANGIADASALAQVFRDSTQVAIIAKRPKVFTRVVPKGGKKLGIQLKHAPEGAALCVTMIQEDGAAFAGKVDIKEGDVIVSVDGAFGPAKDLLNTIANSESPKLLVLRAT